MFINVFNEINHLFRQEKKGLKATVKHSEDKKNKIRT